MRLFQQFCKIKTRSDLNIKLFYSHNRTENEFEKCNCDISFKDFKLYRVDVATDRILPSEECIQQFIMLMRRMPLAAGYKINTAIEDNTPDFRKCDSYNLINKSRGIEFVLYNKSRGAHDEKYASKEQDYYANTLRM